jgi:hypothetical protein
MHLLGAVPRFANDTDSKAKSRFRAHSYLSFFKEHFMTLSPNFVEDFGFVADTITLAALLIGLRLALKRAQLPARSTIWLGISALVFAWYGLIMTLAKHDVFRATPIAKSPALPLAVFGPVLLLLWLILRSESMAKIVDATPLSWLVGAQFYRVLGVIFLVLWGAGQLPWQFALPAGGGDVLVGLFAIPIALAANNGSKASSNAAFRWNVLGIIDLAVAVGTGFLTSPGPFQLLAINHPNLFVSRYPLVMIPAFMVPLSFILHGISLWKLRRMAKTSDSKAPAIHAGRGLNSRQIA